MIKPIYYEDESGISRKYSIHGHSAIEIYKRAIFIDTIFDSIGYINNNNMVMFHTNEHKQDCFLNYRFHSERIKIQIPIYENQLKFKNILISDIFKDKISKEDIIDISLNENNLRISIKKISRYPDIGFSSNTITGLTLNFIYNLQTHCKRLITINEKISNFDKQSISKLDRFYYPNNDYFVELDIKYDKQSFINNYTFLNLLPSYSTCKSDESDVKKLIDAVVRSSENAKRTDTITIHHNGVTLKIDPFSSGYEFIALNTKIELEEAIRFLKMTPNFEKFMYRLERIHLGQV